MYKNVFYYKNPGKWAKFWCHCSSVTHLSSYGFCVNVDGFGNIVAFCWFKHLYNIPCDFSITHIFWYMDQYFFKWQHFRRVISSRWSFSRGMLQIRAFVVNIACSMFIKIEQTSMNTSIPNHCYQNIFI